MLHTGAYKCDFLGGEEISKGDLNEADPSSKNTNTKAGKKNLISDHSRGTFLQGCQNFRGTIYYPPRVRLERNTATWNELLHLECIYEATEVKWLQ